MFIFYTILGALFYTIGDILGKYWTLNDSWLYFWVGLAFYSAGGALMFFAMKADSMTMALLVMPPVAITLSLIAGRFIFDEKISSVQYAAGCVILVSIIALLWNPKL
jgi:multidrug transporter EmrE-like cation transporter